MNSTSSNRRFSYTVFVFWALLTTGLHWYFGVDSGWPRLALYLGPFVGSWAIWSLIAGHFAKKLQAEIEKVVDRAAAVVVDLTKPKQEPNSDAMYVFDGVAYSVCDALADYANMPQKLRD